jgi:hypothetical protein
VQDQEQEQEHDRACISVGRWIARTLRSRKSCRRCAVKERRSSKRAKVDLLLNKYINGFPHACRVLDLSMGGMLVRRINEPEATNDSFPLELGLPGDKDPMWIWSRPIWTQGKRQAIRFVALDPEDRARLATYLGAVRRAA